jgi:uncharacterized protein (DUF58 family)
MKTENINGEEYVKLSELKRNRVAEILKFLLLIFLVLFSLFCCAFILSATALRHLKIARRFSERAFAGDLVTVTLTVSNPARLPTTGLLITESLKPAAPASKGAGADTRAPQQRAVAPLLPRPVEGALGGETFATVVAGRDRERTQYALPVRRRGLYQFAPTRLTTIFPFGFWRTYADPTEAGRLVVYPRLGEIDAAFFQEVEQALHRLRRCRPAREEQEYRGLREFRHGDYPKWIHWRYSAHYGSLLVKEFEQPQARRVLLLVDTNLLRLGPQRLPAFELALSFAATAAAELARRGSEVICLTHPPGAPLEQVSVSRERRNLDLLFELLAGLRPDPTRTLADARAHIPRGLLRHAYVLVLGLGSLRLGADLSWLSCPESLVKVLDVRGEEFRRIFRRTPGALAARGELDEDLLPLLTEGAEDEAEEAPAAAAGGTAREA